MILDCTRERSEVASRATVFMDGKKLPYCVYADNVAGEATVLMQDHKSRFIADDEGTVLAMTLYGRIEIVIAKRS